MKQMKIIVSTVLAALVLVSTFCLKPRFEQTTTPVETEESSTTAVAEVEESTDPISQDKTTKSVETPETTEKSEVQKTEEETTTTTTKATTTTTTKPKTTQATTKATTTRATTTKPEVKKVENVGSGGKATGSPTIYSPKEFRNKGAIKWNGWRWTWYSEKVLPGGGLKIPGRHSDGNYVRDEDGYLCLASSVLAKGTIVDTPFGSKGKVYDSGCPKNTLDVYVSW